MEKQKNEHFSRLKETKGRSLLMLVLGHQQPNAKHFLSLGEILCDPPTYGPPYFQICCCQVNIVFIRPASSLEVPMDSTSPQEPLIEWSFMTSRRVVPLWVVQPCTADVAWRPDLLHGLHFKDV